MMSPAQGGTSVVQSRWLRTALRREREANGYTQKRVASELGWSISKVIRQETGASAISTADAMALIHFYNITDQSRTEQMLAITRAKDSAWWDKYSSFYGQEFLDFLGYEHGASMIRQFQGLLVPGLLQTEAYASALFHGYMEDKHRFERAVRVRMRRQAILDANDGRRFDFIIDESVLHRWVGGPAVMLEQLTHIEAMSQKPNVSIRIVPFTVGVRPFMQGSFTIFEFDSDALESVVNVEDPHSDVRLRDDAETTSKYVETFIELSEIAASAVKTTEIVTPVVEVMRAAARE